MSSIYLDNAATTRMHSAVRDAMQQCYEAGYVNPASQHAVGRQARAKLDDAREEVVHLLGGAHDSQLVLTSGGTEANNMAVLGLAGESPCRIVVSQIEHPSIRAAAQLLQRKGFDVHWIPTLATGVIDLAAAIKLVTPATKLVSVMAGNHETGVVQPIEQIADRCAQLGVQMHIDAVQCIGKMAMDFSALGVAAMTVTPHKFHGPRGIGALLLQPDVRVEPLLHGGSQQFGVRPGTEDVALAIGLVTAIRYAINDLATNVRHLTLVRDAFESTLSGSGCVINGSSVQRLPHISNVAFCGLSRESLLMNLDLLGVACSTGSACASGSSEPSPVLQAMNLPDDVINGSLRFSFSCETTVADCRLAAAHILKSINNLESGFSPT